MAMRIPAASTATSPKTSPAPSVASCLPFARTSTVPLSIANIACPRSPCVASVSPSAASTSTAAAAIAARSASSRSANSGIAASLDVSIADTVLTGPGRKGVLR